MCGNGRLFGVIGSSKSKNVGVVPKKVGPDRLDRRKVPANDLRHFADQVVADEIDCGAVDLLGGRELGIAIHRDNDPEIGRFHLR